MPKRLLGNVFLIEMYTLRFTPGGAWNAKVTDKVTHLPQ